MDFFYYINLELKFLSDFLKKGESIVMSLEFCEDLDLKNVKIKESWLFKGRFTMTVSAGQKLICEMIGQEHYLNKRAFYFPALENFLFFSASKNSDLKMRPLKFTGTSIKDDEIEKIKTYIENYKLKEKEEYKVYKKNLDKALSGLIENLSAEIDRQKEFLNQSLLTVHQLDENTDLLVKNYMELIEIKLGQETGLLDEDRQKIYDFYKNMIMGIKKNAGAEQNNNA